MRRQRKFRQDIPESIAKIIHQFFNDSSDTQLQLIQSQIVLAWPRVVGQSIAKISMARRFQDGRILVHVPDPLWRQELAFQKSAILARFQAEFPNTRLSDIYFTS